MISAMVRTQRLLKKLPWISSAMANLFFFALEDNVSALPSVFTLPNDVSLYV
jgi:virulence-associated protein VapD